jgi:hypothetical protein
MVVGKVGREHSSLEDKMEISKDGKFPRPLPAGYELLVFKMGSVHEAAVFSR